MKICCGKVLKRAAELSFESQGHSLPFSFSGQAKEIETNASFESQVCCSRFSVSLHNTDAIGKNIYIKERTKQIVSCIILLIGRNIVPASADAFRIQQSRM
jgi:hypothetical protein